MQHREHDNRVLRRPEVNGVGEGVEESSVNLGRDGRELERAFADSCEGSTSPKN